MKKWGAIKPGLWIGVGLPWTRPGKLRLVLPPKRAWPAIAFIGVLFLAFSAPLVPVSQMLIFRAEPGLFDLAFNAFIGAWMLGWSVGVVILGLVFFALLLGREVVVVKPGSILIRFELLGPGIGAVFDAAHMRNLRQVVPVPKSGTAWRGPHVAFDFAGAEVGFGSDIEGARAEEIMLTIQQALGTPIADGSWRPAADAAPAPSNSRERGTRSGMASAPPVGIKSPSTVVLIAANLIPLAGVLFMNWDLGDVMVLFWTESAVVGFYNLLKMGVIDKLGVIVAGPFFLGHFGAFMAIHFLFIYTFFVHGIEADRGLVPLSEVAATFRTLAPAILALFVSHGVSFWVNFLGGREYEGRTMKAQMSEPYKRIIIMHVTILFGGFLAMALDSALPALLLLLGLKIIVDTCAHLNEHKPADQAS